MIISASAFAFPTSNITQLIRFFENVISTQTSCVLSIASEESRSFEIQNFSIEKKEDYNLSMESQTTNSFTSTYQNFTTLMQTTPNVTKLLPPCGQPGYCTYQIYNNCKNTILSECEECSVSLGVIMITLIILLGIGIVLGNSLIIYVGYHKCKKGKHDKTDLCKTSLAAADMITGKFALKDTK